MNQRTVEAIKAACDLLRELRDTIADTDSAEMITQVLVEVEYAMERESPL